MRRGAGWHSRPILGPFVYAASTAVMGSASYVSAFFLTYSIQKAAAWMLVVDGFFVLYLVMCELTSSER